MPLLQPLAGRAFMIPGANNLGVVATDDGGAIVIDTGLDKDTGRLIRKALDEARISLRAIINTHHHADHIGGNDFLLRAYPAATVYAPPLEAALIEHPLLEPVYLSMGAAPVAALQTKWLMAKASPVHQRITSEQLEIHGVRLAVVPLPGHSLGQVGVVVDQVCFAADGFFGLNVLAKHGIPYAQEISGQLASLDRLAGVAAEWFVPGHGEVLASSQLAPTLEANRQAIHESSAAVYQATAEPGDLHQIGRRVRQQLALNPGGLPQYAIFLSAISAHLGLLLAQGRVELMLDAEGMLWRQTQA